MTNGSQQSALRASRLSVGYRRKRETAKVILSGLDLQLRQGEFTCLLGPNGAGKSTLMRVLSGVDQPLEGGIWIGDDALDKLAPQDRARRISVVLTEAMPMGVITGRSIAALGRHPHTNWAGTLTARDRERVEWALEAVGATALADRQVSELSDGERQKIMLARALAQEASLMLLDEPTAYLDLPRRVELMQLLRDLTRREGLSILLSTHDLDLGLRSADRLWLVDASGRLHSGVPEELALDGSLASTFASKTLDWDEEQGSFRMHREPCARVRLEGEGAVEVWTRRALMRIGYGLAEREEEVAIAVWAWKHNGQPVWKAQPRGEESRSFNRLSELLGWMLNPDRYRNGKLDPHRQTGENGDHAL